MCFMKALKIDNDGNAAANNQSVDDHRVNVVDDEEVADIDLTRFFDLELPNSKCNTARKLLQNRSTKLMSRQ